MGGGSIEPSWNFVRIGFGDGMNTCSQSSGCIEQNPTHACQAKPPPSSYYPVVTAVPRWTLPNQAPTTRAWTDYITYSLRRVKTFVKCRKFAKTCSTAMSRDASEESTKTQGYWIRHISTGTRMKQGDLVLVKEADSALHNDCVHVKLTHDR